MTRTSNATHTINGTPVQLITYGGTVVYRRLGHDEKLRVGRKWWNENAKRIQEGE